MPLFTRLEALTVMMKRLSISWSAETPLLGTSAGLLLEAQA